MSKTRKLWQFLSLLGACSVFADVPKINPHPNAAGVVAMRSWDATPGSGVSWQQNGNFLDFSASSSGSAAIWNVKDLKNISYDVNVILSSVPASSAGLKLEFSIGSETLQYTLVESATQANIKIGAVQPGAGTFTASIKGADSYSSFFTGVQRVVLTPTQRHRWWNPRTQKWQTELPTGLGSQWNSNGVFNSPRPKIDDLRVLNNKGFVIVTSEDLKSKLTKLNDYVAHKQSLGFTVYVITEADYGQGKGTLAVKNIRDWLRNNYQSKELLYALMLGDSHPLSGQVPMAGLNTDLVDTQSRFDAGEDIYVGIPSDMPYADCSGATWDLNGDNIYDGGGDWGPDGIDGSWDILVGRIPYYGEESNYGKAEDLDAILTKIISYETETNIDYRYNFEVTYGCWNISAALHEWAGNEYMIRVLGTHTGVDYLDYLNNDKFLSKYTVGEVRSGGHGSPVWQEGGLTTDRIRDMFNNGLQNFSEIGSCDTGQIEHPENLAYMSIRYGSVGCEAPTRSVASLYSNKGTGPVEFDDNPRLQMLVNGTSQGYAHWQAYMSGNIGFSSSLKMWTLFGDPSIKIFPNGLRPTYPVVVRPTHRVQLNWDGGASRPEQEYDVTNNSDSTKTVTYSTDVNWLTLNKTGEAISVGSTATLIATVNASADSLPEEISTAYIYIKDENGVTRTRPFNLRKRTPQLLADITFDNNSSSGAPLHGDSGVEISCDQAGLVENGVVGQAYDMSYTSTGLVISNSLVPNPAGADMSVSFWINSDTALTDDTPILEGTGLGFQGGELNMSLINSGSQLKLRWPTTDYWGSIEKKDILVEECIANVSLSENSWHHVTFTMQQDDSFRMYWDGQEVASFQQNSHTYNFDDLIFGKSFSGLIDEIKITNYALSAAEVAGLYNKTTSLPAHIGVTEVAPNSNQPPILNQSLLDLGTLTGGQPILPIDLNSFATDPEGGELLFSCTNPADGAWVHGSGYFYANDGVRAADAQTMNVKVEDDHGQAVYFDITFDVEQPPVFDEANLMVLETATVGETVGTVVATDANAGDSIMGYVAVAGDALNKFALAVDGTVTVTGALNYDVQSSYSLVVRATDQGGLYTDKEFTISVGNVVGLPLVSVSSTQFDEATLAETGFSLDIPDSALASITLDDVNDRLNFTTTGNTDMWWGRNNAPIAYLDKPDSQSWAVETEIEMDNSQNVQIGGLTVYEDTDGAKPLFSYGLDYWSGGAGLINLQGLGTNNPLINVSALSKSRVKLRMEVIEDGAGPGVGRYTFAYDLLDGNGMQVLTTYDFATENSRIGLFLKNGNGARTAYFHSFEIFEDIIPSAEDVLTNVAESVTVGTVVATVNGVDPENDSLTYQIIAGNDSGLFAIDNSGQITTTGALDYEVTSQHVLTIEVSDGTYSDTVTVTLNIDDIVDLVDGDVIAVDLSSAGGSAANYNVINTSARSIAAGQVVEYNSQTVRPNISVTLSAVHGFNDDANAGNWGGTAADTYYETAADDITYSPGDISLTFSGLDDSFSYNVRVYALINDGVTDTISVTDGSGTQSTTEVRSTRFAAATLEDAGLVFSNLATDGSGNIVVTTHSSNGWEILNAVVLEAIAPNYAPVASADSATVDEDDAVVINVLANDSDANGDNLTVTAVTQGACGSVTTDGTTVNYTPSPTCSGLDSFTYTITDGEFTDTTSVSVSITSLNDAPVAVNDSATVDEDGSVVVSVLTNDSDIDSTISVWSVTQGTNGTVTTDGTTVTYTPAANFSGADSFTYTVTDGALTDTATVSVTVNPVNDAPVAIADSVVINEDASVVVSVLANDNDSDSSISIASVTQGASGTVTTDGATVTYIPTANYNGADSFTYTVTDGVLTDTATVSVTVNPVNDAPVATGFTTSVSESAAVGEVLGTVATNDIDGDALTYQITAGNEIPLFAIDANGQVTTTAGLDYETVAQHVLTVEVSDTTDITTATVTIDVTDVKNLAVDDVIAVDLSSVGGSASNFNVISTSGGVIPAGSVITHADGSTREAVSVTLSTVNGLNDDPNAANWGGAATDAYYSVEADDIAFSPSPITLTFAGLDPALKYNARVYALINDGASDTVTVTDGASTQESTEVRSTRFAATTLEEAGLVFSELSADVNGELAVTVSSGAWEILNAVVLEVVSPNTAPVATDDSAFVNEDAFISIAVLSNDSDVDGDNLSISAVTQGSNGSVVIEDSSVKYTPVADFNGADSFTYTITDGELTATATVSVTVNAVNDAPIAVNDSVVVNEDGSVVATVLTNDSDIEGSVSIDSVTQGTNGSVSTNGTTVTYTPTANYNGADSFTYTITDGELTDTATVSVTVNAVNDAPIAVNDSVVVNEDGSVVATVLTNDSDIEGSVSIGSVTQGANGSVSTNGTTVTYTPTANYNGADSFTYTITDGELTDTATVSVTVNAVVDLAVVSISAATSIDVNSATANYTITATGDEDPTVTLYYGLTNEGQTENWDNSMVIGTQSVGAFSSVLSSLIDNTNYFYTIKAVNSAGTIWGSTIAFTTNANLTPKLYRTTVSSVTTDKWVRVNVPNYYHSMVVVATPRIVDQNNAPVVSRITNVGNTSFDLIVQRADGGSATFTAVDVDVMVVEEGSYTAANCGVDMEAYKHISTKTTYKNNYATDQITPVNTYTSPVVIGQVMSFSDSRWSVFWSCDGNRANVPTASSIYIGKSVGEDPDKVRNDETLGYIIIESGVSTVNGTDFECGIGSDSVMGIGKSPAYTYTLSGSLTSATNAILSAVAFDGVDQGWPVLYGSTPVTATTLSMAYDEDMKNDAERNHTTEQVAYIVFE